MVKLFIIIYKGCYQFKPVSNGLISLDAEPQIGATEISFFTLKKKKDKTPISKVWYFPYIPSKQLSGLKLVARPLFPHPSGGVGAFTSKKFVIWGRTVEVMVVGFRWGGCLLTRAGWKPHPVVGAGLSQSCRFSGTPSGKRPSL